MNSYSNKNHKKLPNEKIIINPSPPDEYPFWITQCGTTYKDRNYHEIRLDSGVSCIEYVVSGSGIINSNKKSFLVNKGDTYMLLEGQEHNYYSDANDPFQKTWFNFRGVLSEEIIKVYKLENAVLFKNTNIMPLLMEMHDLCQNAPSPEVIQTEGSCLFLKIIQFLSKNHQKITTDSVPVDIIRYYIDCNITQNIKMSDICQIANYTAQHIIRLFKQKYGITPHQYILNSKIKISLAMLRATNKSIEEIANELSFSDPHHFSHLFEKKMGVRPSVYRKNFIKSQSI